jgi:hypothetical protein
MRSDPRSPAWGPRWEALIKEAGGAELLAGKIGITYQTLWRWGVKGANVPKTPALLIRRIAIDLHLQSPV